METLSPELSNKNHDKKEVELPNIALNQILQQKAKSNLQGSLKWKTFIFPSLSHQTPFAGISKQYFCLDLVDEGKERTH